MKKNVWIASIVGVVVLSAALCFIFANRGGSGKLMSMAQSGASETEMLNVAEKAPAERLSADQVIQLKKAGVPDNVIITLLRKNSAGAAGVANK